MVIVLVILVIVLIIVIFFVRTSTGSIARGGALGCSAPPDAPTGVTVSNPQSDIISVQWNEVEDADTYRIYISRSPGFLTRDAEDVKSTDAQTISFGDFATGFTYFIKVTSFNSCGESIASNEISITIPFVYPDRFQITNFDDATIRFTMDPGDATYPYRASAIPIDCVPADCWYNYNELDQTIRLQSDDTRCITANGTEVWIDPCNSSALVDRQWIYNPEENSICLVSDSNRCIRVPASFFDMVSEFEGIELGLSTNDVFSQWELLEV